MTALPKRWLAAGGAAVLAAIVGVALLLQTGAEPACAAPPTGSTVHKGKATFYDMGGGTGNCSFPSVPANDLFVALGASEYGNGAACGGYLDVTGPKGKVRVKVVDSCPPCSAGHIDLSRTAFGKIADHVQGIIPITYKAVVNPPVPGPLSVRFEGGSTRYWMSFQVDNHGNPLRTAQIRTGSSGSWASAARQKHGVWVVNGGAGSGPFQLRLTDVYGRVATASGVRLTGDVTQKLSARFGGKAGAPLAQPSPAKKKPSPTPSKAAPPSAAPLIEATTVPSGEPAAAAADPTALALAGDADRC